jgi:hypothetical protein
MSLPLIPALMFTCSHCHKPNLIRSVDRDAGDCIVICSFCGTKNILQVTWINRIPVPTIEIAGYRD